MAQLTPQTDRQTEESDVDESSPAAALHAAREQCKVETLCTLLLSIHTAASCCDTTAALHSVCAAKSAVC